MKLLILYFSLYASKPAILDDIDNMEFEKFKPNSAIINGDMNHGYLKELLKSAWKYIVILTFLQHAYHFVAIGFFKILKTLLF